MTTPRSKTLATWLALTGGAFGAHRFYLRGVRDVLAWLHIPATLAGLHGLQRVAAFGHDDRIAWPLLPLLGLMIAQAMLHAIAYGLTADERWDARWNGGRASSPAGWGAVLGVIAALLIGATSLMAAIAYGGQRFFEWQLDAATTQSSSRPSP